MKEQTVHDARSSHHAARDRRRRVVRPGCGVVLLACLTALGACGGDSSSSNPVGTPENPAVPHSAPAKPNATGEAGPAGASTGEGEEPTRAGTAQPPATTKPGYRDLVDEQSKQPANRATPCALVTRAQAQSIVGVRLLEPLEAPQGPTCIYRTAANKNVITLAVQSASIENLRRQMRDRVRVRVGDKVAYCGTLGRPTLYVPLSAGRVLSITAACDIAKQFAVKALPRVAA